MGIHCIIKWVVIKMKRIVKIDPLGFNSNRVSLALCD